MPNRSVLITIAVLSGFFLFDRFASAAAINAASCKQPDVLAAYNAVTSGDTIFVPAGNCSASNAWTSTLAIQNQVTIQGAGIGNTIIGVASSYTSVFKIMVSNVRITGFTFDGKNKNSTNAGAIYVGQDSTADCDGIYSIADFRIDHNSFINFTPSPLPADGVTGWSAIRTSGYSYGVVDNNTFDNCNGECLDLNADGPRAYNRSLAYGGYTNGTIFIEDNTWNYTTPINAGDYGAENAFDGNSGGRWVIRFNTFNIAANTRVQAMISNHETCVSSACDAATQGDAGTATMEVYGNKVYNNGTGSFGVGTFIHQRGGRALIYNNTIFTNDTTDQYIARLSNLRSFPRGRMDEMSCNVTHARGYSSYCHESEGSYTVEGMSFNKTTLDGGLGNDNACPQMASVAGFPTYGGSILVGTEQIDYSGIGGPYARTLTPCTRGTNSPGGSGPRAAHSDGSAVNLLIFGTCLEQINTTYVWGNKTVGSADKNGVHVANYDEMGWPDTPDYSLYDIQSYAQRPQNWQYRSDGTAYSYTSYPYPHPLTLVGSSDTTPPAPPTGVRVR